MFALHETTRKRVCRTAFLALCVAPTLAMASWTASHHWPGRHGRLSRELGRTLDVHVKLADWREPRPQTVRTSGMTLSDGATGQVLVNVARLEMQTGRGSQVLRIEEATVEASQLIEVACKVDRWLRLLPPEAQEVRCRRLVIRLPSPGESSPAGQPRQFVMHNVHVRIDRDAAGRIQAQGIGLIDGIQDVAHAVRLALLPSTGSGAEIALTLETGPIGVAASALAEVLPGFGRLGNDSVFVGKAQWLFAGAEQQGVVEGRVSQADLAGVLPANSPHRLRGRATVELAELTWHGERVERLAGAVLAEQASISRSLVEAAVTNFRCGRGTEGQPAADDPTLVVVDRLGIRFDLNGEGLTFWGACPPESSLEEACMAVSGLQPLLIAPPLRNWHVGWLVQTLMAPPSGWLPATREAVELGDRLPLPLK
jgi:hypothetical protein